MAEPLTKKQKLILDFVRSFSKKKGYSPTHEEIGKKFKLSVSSVNQYLTTLKEKGHIQKNKGHARSIELIGSESMIKIPLLGTIAAGAPIEAIQEKEMIAVPKSKIPSSSGVYALRVVGNSMIDENINDGDIVLVKQQDTAENGQKVVALINNNEATLKKFYKEKYHIRLQPANKNIEPIIIKRDKEISIQGILIDVIKNENPETTFFLPKKEEAQKYDKLPLNKIICGDTIREMKKFPDNSIDLIFADPPYNLSKSNFKMKFVKSGGTDLNTNKGNWDKFQDDDFEIFTKNWLSECFRILKENGGIWVAGTYHNIYITGYLMRKLGFETLNEVLWHKSDATPNMSCTRFVADHENFIWARKGKKHTFNYTKMKQLNNGRQMRSIWTKGKTAGGKKIHPTQKPEWLLERIILASSGPNDIIFDPFLGSGTTAVVAKRYHRFYLGVEIDPIYYQISLDRIKKTIPCLATI